jgi:isocitrate/isopropylmalate dehydrogenase
MLRHLGEQDAANKVKYAVHSVYREGKHITRDMGGTASTNEFADAVIGAMESTAWRVQAAKETNPV